MKKKVGYLLRVSTKKQVNKEDDIPMQRNACLEFIDKHEDWEVYKEYLEPGVSGFHKRVEDRDVLQRAIADVKAKKFDVFLVFMFDRLGRIDDETPFLLKNIVARGIEVWSVCEGQQKFENAADDLMIYIRFWGASNESKKTAVRVDCGRNYGTRQGRFTGGRIPYGYMLQQTGNLDKKGRMINDFVRNPEESKVVEIIFNQLVDNNMTLNGIITFLNEDMKKKTRLNKKWNTSTVRNILRNPIYKGYMSYGKTRMVEVYDDNPDELMIRAKRKQKSVSSDHWILAEERNEDYVIVSEEKWQLAQDILARRNKKYQDNLRPIADRTWKSSLLLVGLLKCGYCHGAISPAVSSQKSISKDGSVGRCYTEFYKCNTRGRDKRMCESKSYISKYKLEKVVLDEVYGFLERLEKVDCTEEIRKNIAGNSSSDKNRLMTLKKEVDKVQRAIYNMKDEIYRSYTEEIELDRKFISDALKRAEEKEKELQCQIKELELSIKSKEIAVDEYEKTVKMIPVWREVFEEAPINIKKHLLTMLIEKIVVKGSEVDIFFKVDIDNFLRIQSGNYEKESGNTSEVELAVKKERESYKKVIEDNVSVNGCNI